MKRFNFENDSRNPSRFPVHIRGGYQGIRNSSKRGNTDTSHRKRVRFADSFQPDDPSQTENPPSCRSTDAQTSEYAFFKKVKGHASQVHHSYTKDYSGNQSKSLKSSDCVREKSSIARSSCKDLKPSFLIDNALPVTSNSRLSSLGNALENSDEKSSSCTISGDIYSTPENSEKPEDSLMFSGTYKSGGVFSRKREKLRQWVADVSYPGIDELCSKGYSHVSILLSRLFPEDGNQHFGESKSKKVDGGAIAKSLICPDKDEKLRRTPMGADALQFMDSELLGHWSNRSSKIMPAGFQSATYHSRETGVEDRTKVPEKELGGRNSPLLFSGISTYNFPCTNTFRASRHLEELDEFYDFDASLLEREPNTPLLGWLHDNMAYERNSSLITHGTKLKFESEPNTPLLGWVHDNITYQRNLPLTTNSAELKVEREPNTPFVGWVNESMTYQRNIPVTVHSPELSVEREPNTPLLGWVHDNITYQKNIPVTTHSAELRVQREPNTLLLGWVHDNTTYERNIPVKRAANSPLLGWIHDNITYQRNTVTNAAELRVDRQPNTPLLGWVHDNMTGERNTSVTKDCAELKVERESNILLRGWADKMTYQRNIPVTTHSAEPKVKREPNTPLQGWVHDNVNYERNTTVTNHREDLMVYNDASSLSLANDPLHSLGNIVGATEFRTSFFLSDVPSDNTSFLHSSLALHDDLDLARPDYEDNGVLASNFNLSPITMVHKPNFLSLAEECNHGASCKSGVFLSTQNDKWFMSKISLNREKALPMLLEDPSQDGPEEVCFDDSKARCV